MKNVTVSFNEEDQQIIREIQETLVRTEGAVTVTGVLRKAVRLLAANLNKGGVKG
jgi:hypothetical protein